jgi:hypothetical protein
VTKDFAHPLARAGRVWRSELHDGSMQRVLVIVTTLELDPASPRYQDRLVEQLSRAAHSRLARFSDADGFVLINRLRHRHWHQRLVSVSVHCIALIRRAAAAGARTRTPARGAPERA